MPGVNKRRNLGKAVVASALGLGLVLTKKAKAVNPVDSPTLMAIAASTADIFKKVSEISKTYNNVAGDTNKILYKFSNVQQMMDAFENRQQTILNQKNRVKSFFDRVYAVGKDPLSNRVPNFYPESEPVIRDTSLTLDNLAAIANKSVTNERKSELNQHARFIAGQAVGRVAAQTSKAKIDEIKKTAASSSTDDSAAKVFAENSAPLRADISQLILESNLRQEELLISIFEKLNGKKLKNKHQKFDKTSFHAALKNYQNGKGTL